MRLVEFKRPVEWKVAAQYLRRAFLAINFYRYAGGWMFYVRTPLLGFHIARRWYGIQMFPHNECGIYFWPNLPITDGGLIYRYQKVRYS